MRACYAPREMDSREEHEAVWQPFISQPEARTRRDRDRFALELPDSV